MTDDTDFPTGTTRGVLSILRLRSCSSEDAALTTDETDAFLTKLRLLCPKPSPIANGPGVHSRIEVMLCFEDYGQEMVLCTHNLLKFHFVHVLFTKQLLNARCL